MKTKMQLLKTITLQFLDLIRNAHWVVLLMWGFCLGAVFANIQKSISCQLLPKAVTNQHCLAEQEISQKKIPEGTRLILEWRDGKFSSLLEENK
jgi:uncharacterized membrane protein YccF (DUF307 family)